MKKRISWGIFVAISLLAGGFLLTCNCIRLEEKPREKKLLVYCGITMIKPMSEIAKIIELQENCKIIITKGGSGNLLKSININKVGDLYLPGDESYMNGCLKQGIVTEAVFVGYNKAAMMVRKGNPKQITADLENLASGKYYVVICNPTSGSIGKETKRILTKRGMYERVIQNAQSLTTASKGLTLAIKNKEADLVINWYATSTWPENKPYVDVIPIDEKYASKAKLVLGLLKTSKHPQIARRFMQHAASLNGRAIFRKHGLYDVR